MTTQTGRPLVALVSAVRAAIPPAEAAFAAEFPGAELWNILDDRLLAEVDDRGGLTPELASRMERLIRHAITEGADGVLVTCSVYGSVVHALKAADATAGLPVPAFASDDAAFAAVLAGGHRSVLLLSPARAPLADSFERLSAAATAAGVDIAITAAVAEGAPAAAAAGDVEMLAEILHDTYLTDGAGVDAVLLGQYSLSPAGPALAERIGLPVLTAPHRAAVALREAVEQGGRLP
ncbi:hypothetical protein N1028_11365 [Herbiconiux sp. CPCC 203407]|uniref:Asp/Glu racemase n=1 Tax=Herbiconiux oxytropis TaxID=2970915 RepID=A0AA41XE43_9MICO|nr:hypothetical protein [Herbiconiux oxytropis]MCS5722552.1 hypothetical protein [Herbiconiux oxytropis]MCS5726492.1 hypothetical protein [Herbiconiux oxytropis]